LKIDFGIDHGAFSEVDLLLLLLDGRRRRRNRRVFIMN